MAAAALLLLWIALVFLYTRANGFPYFYHNDEPSKVAQVLSDTRNFFHPQLLLATTDLIMRLGDIPRKAQACVEAGRLASAGFAAGAVCLFAWLAGRLRGATAAIVAAAIGGLHPLLFELSHYLKEDCAWLFGLAAFLLAAHAFERKPGVVAALILGAAAGIATSGKYIGVITLPAGTLFILSLTSCSRGQRGRWLLALSIGFLAAFCLINWEAFAEPAQAIRGVRMELAKIRDLSADQPELVQWKAAAKYLKEAWPAEAPLTAVFALWFLLCPARLRERERGRTEWLLLLLPATLFAVLLFAPRMYDRYLLPIIGAQAVLAALGASDAAELLTRPSEWKHARAVVTLVAGLAAAATQWPALQDCWNEFHSDPRAELCAWINQHVPADATIAHDSRALLTWGRQEGDYQFPQPTIQPVHSLAELGSLDVFKGWGVQWYVVAEEDYDALLHPPELRAKAAELKKSYDDFYGKLFEEGQLVWEYPKGSVIYLHPKLKVYYEVLGEKEAR